MQTRLSGFFSLQTFLCCNMPQLKFYPALGVSQKFDASHKFVTSPVIRSPVVFAAARVTIAFYTFFTLLFTLIWKSVKQHTGNRYPLFPEQNGLALTLSCHSYFSYFTDLSYIGICAYYCAAATQTIAYALKWKKSGAGVGCPLYSWPKFLQALHVILQASVVTFRACTKSRFTLKPLTIIDSAPRHNCILGSSRKTRYIRNSIFRCIFVFVTISHFFSHHPSKHGPIYLFISSTRSLHCLKSYSQIPRPRHGSLLSSISCYLLHILAWHTLHMPPRGSMVRIPSPSGLHSLISSCSLRLFEPIKTTC